MQIQFSQYHFNLKVEKGFQLIFDIIRKKFVLLTPEEWVRQHIIHYLVLDLKYPKALISVEKQLILNGLQKRTDIVLYNRLGSAVLIVECKAPDVKMTQAVLDQVARYNLKLAVPYLLVSNGKIHALYRIDHSKQTWMQINEFPEIAEMVDP